MSQSAPGVPPPAEPPPAVPPPNEYDAPSPAEVPVPSPALAVPSERATAAVPLLPLSQEQRVASSDPTAAAVRASSQGGIKASTGRRPASGTGSVDNKTCNCRNSKCLKLYCECFASGRYCNACNCANCMNNTMNEAARSKAIETILERNPNAFRPKIQFQQEDGTQTTKITRHSKGCSCRKSHCLKKYCECFQAGIFCGGTCRCKDCRNYEGSAALASLMDVADVAASRQTSGMLGLGPPDSKRPRTAARSGSGAGLQTQHYMPDRPDPAREAINNLRGRKMHEVLAHMLTSMHSEAHNKEEERWKAGKVDPGDAQASARPAPPSSAAQKPDEGLSSYYAETEGTLLSEFGSFLGNLADRIDEQLQKQPS